MTTCSSCGVSIPDGQQFCSMCYGDPDYGRDGIYRKWLEDQAQQQAYNEYIEEQDLFNDDQSKPEEK